MGRIVIRPITLVLNYKLAVQSRLLINLLSYNCTQHSNIFIPTTSTKAALDVVLHSASPLVTVPECPRLLLLQVQVSYTSILDVWGVQKKKSLDKLQQS